MQVVFLGVSLASDKSIGNGQGKVQEVDTVAGGICCPGEFAKAQVRFESVKGCVGNCRSPYDEAIINESSIEEQRCKGPPLP